MGTKNDVTVITRLETEAAEPKLKRPSLYKVVVFNDNYTPMFFVVEVFKRFFSMGEAQAVQMMWQVHIVGKATCGTYSFDVAETKVAQVNNYSQANQHPLLCGMEAA